MLALIKPHCNTDTFFFLHKHLYIYIYFFFNTLIFVQDYVHLGLHYKLFSK